MCVCVRERETEIETPRKTTLNSIPSVQAFLRIKITGGLMCRALSLVGPVSIGNLVSATKPIVECL